MDEKQLLTYLLTKQFNLSDEEVTGLLYDEDKLKEDAGDVILAKNAEKIATLQRRGDENFDKGHKKATKEVMKTVEGRFRELTGFEEEAADFDDLVTKFKDKKGKVQVSDDDVKKHPLFVQLEQGSIPKAKLDEIKEEYDSFKKQTTRGQILSQVKGKAWDLVATKRPIMSDNPVVAENRRQDFLSKLDGFDYEEQNGTWIVVKDGKRMEDQHGNLMPFDTFVTGLAQMNFDFKAQDDRGNAGNEQKETMAITDRPKTKQEYIKAMDKYNGNTQEDAKARIAVTKYYEDNKTD